MLIYYLRLALLSYRRNPVLSTLMVLAVAVGVGAYMVVFTLNYFMGGDPIPHKSDRLYHVQLDYGLPEVPEFETPPQLTYIDAMALLDLTTDRPRTVSSKFSAVLEPEGVDTRPFMINGRGALADFFTMFDVPFLFGGPWSREADDQRARVAVLSREMNEQLFGGADSVGRRIRLHGEDFQVVGVLDQWTPMPKFYDVNNGPFDPSEEIYVPWHLIVDLELRRGGNTNCWERIEGNGLQAFLNAECAWIQYWVELPQTTDQEDYLNLVDNYASSQIALGRFRGKVDQRLYDVNEWLLKEEVLPDETQILAMLAAMLLAVCLLNTVGLLLAKFLGKSSELGLRRALGAHTGSLFIQHVIEASVIGVMGGILGLGVASLGLAAIKRMLDDVFFTDWMQLNLEVALIAIAVAVVATVLAGLYPIWRACNVSASMHLKIQ